MGVGGERHAPAASPPAKTHYPLYRRVGGHQHRCGRVRKISSPPGFGPRTVQPVASRYTDCAVLVQRYLSVCSETFIGWPLCFGDKDCVVWMWGVRHNAIIFGGMTHNWSLTGLFFSCIQVSTLTTCFGCNTGHRQVPHLEKSWRNTIQATQKSRTEMGSHFLYIHND